MFAAKNELLTRPSGSYQISRSLRFRSSASAYLSRTPASAGNRKTWTWSGWIKRGTLSTRQALFSAGAVSTTPSGAIYFSTTTDTLTIIGGGGVQYNLVTTQVFRDVSSFYHIVIAFDTTQATDTNRIKVYVNGVIIPTSAFSSTSYPSLNFNTDYNNNVLTAIGSRTDDGTPPVSSFDGYMAEVNFIDGYPTVSGTTYNATTWAALNVATLFGAFDTNGVWQPARYTGSYGTNGFYLPFALNNTSTFAGSFNGSSQYLTTPTSSNLAFGSGDFTIEGWFNQTTLNNCGLIAQDYVTGVDIRFNEGASNAFGFYINNSSFIYGTYTSAFTNQWHHFALVRSGSGSNNVKLYLDGVVLCQTTSTANLTSNQFRIGANLTGNTTPAGTYFSGSISNVRVVKGTAVYTAPFTPSSTALTAITNTQLLCMQNSSATQDNSPNGFTTIINTGTVATATATPFVANITSDASGQNNGWTSNNINYTSSGTTYDSMIDSPTNYADGGNGRGNYAVVNPIAHPTTFIAPTDGNLSQNCNTSAWTLCVATLQIPNGSGLWQWELVQTGTANGANAFGVALSTVQANVTGDPGSRAGCSGVNNSSGAFINGATSGSITYPTVGNTVTCLYDATNLTFQVFSNGTSQGTITGLPAGDVQPFVAASSSNGSPTFVLNFGQRPFAYDKGGKALNTQNLPTPTIANGAQNFDCTYYSGTSAARSVTINNGLFTPDLVWIKNRTAAFNHTLQDVNRTFGSGRGLNSNTTAAEGADDNAYGYISAVGAGSVSVNKIGSLGANDWKITNYSGDSYALWAWKGGNGTSNIAVNAYGSTPSIASTVSANTSAGFSVVTYTGTGANATVGHGLGVAPSMIIVKDRDSSTNGGAVYHASIGATKYLKLFQTAAATPPPSGADAEAIDNTIWNGGSPTFTSSVFSIGTNARTNSTDKYVACCWTPIAGYSSFGSYTGNGSADGVFVYLGFRPKLIIFKDAANAHGWVMIDSSRNTYNVAGDYLWANSSNYEDQTYTVANNTAVDFLSNGFKLRNAAVNSGENNGASTYVYAAWAETPFKTSRAR